MRNAFLGLLLFVFVCGCRADTFQFTSQLTDTKTIAVFGFNINSKRDVQLDTFGSSFDTILGLYGGANNALATYNDDCGWPSSMQSCITMNLWPGTYFATVSSYSNWPPNVLPEGNILFPAHGYYLGSFTLNIQNADSAFDRDAPAPVPEISNVCLIFSGGLIGTLLISRIKG